ncbi:hypothetical protein OPQ81_002626 [Rhizoctonia solani]|nr:hypothetical protein OPQ81_002626 [Rhizoctonia solani]
MRNTHQITDQTLLELPKDKKSVTILLVGESGCGKTAFISLLLSLFQGHDPFELEDLHDATTDSGLNKSCSQTGNTTVYKLETPDRGFNIRFLDTPGLSDSRGPEHDKKNQKEINDAIVKEFTTIDAVIIMSNGTTERLAPTTDYTLKVLMTLFPRSILSNIGFIFTHVESFSFNFQESSIPPELRETPRWLIQNPLALLKHKSVLENENRTARHVRQDKTSIERAYADVIETLNEWLEWIKECPVQPINEINRLYEASAQVQSRFDEVISHIMQLYQQRKEWSNIEEKLRNAEAVRHFIEDICVFF